MRVIPTVARILHYFPAGISDGVLIRRQGGALPDGTPQPLAAIVADVISENSVNLTVFDALGLAFSRVHVPVVQEGDPWSSERCANGWCAWPIIQQPAQTRGRMATDGGRNPNYKPPDAVTNPPPSSPSIQPAEDPNQGSGAPGVPKPPEAS